VRSVLNAPAPTSAGPHLCVGARRAGPNHYRDRGRRLGRPCGAWTGSEARGVAAGAGKRMDGPPAVCALAIVRAIEVGGCHHHGTPPLPPSMHQDQRC
jgi:hypothetical protein